MSSKNKIIFSEMSFEVLVSDLFFFYGNCERILSTIFCSERPLSSLLLNVRNNLLFQVNTLFC